MGTFQQYVQDDPEIVDRFVIHAFKRNSSIKTLDDFKEALKTADPSDDRI
jgi:hypothetical protein